MLETFDVHTQNENKCHYAKPNINISVIAFHRYVMQISLTYNMTFNDLNFCNWKEQLLIWSVH